MTSIAPGLGAAGWRSLAPPALTAPPAATPTLTRERAFSAFSTAILGALGAGGADSGGAAGTAAGRVGDVALALKNALESPAAAGDVVGSLLGTVRAALAQASQALGDAGYSREAIGSLVRQFSHALGEQLNALAGQAAAPASASSAPAPVAAAAAAAPAEPVSPASTPAGAAAGAPGGGSGAVAADYRLTESGALELVTTEGDIVRIGFRASSGGAVVGASASGAAGLAAYASVGAYASSRFSVSVQGSLNADELKAINDVLGEVNALATQFFAGNLSQAFASAATLGADPREIASLALNLTERASLSLASVGDGAPAAAPAPVTPQAPGAASQSAATTATPDAVVAATPATAVSAPPVPALAAGGGTKSLLDYLRQVLDALGSSTESGRVRFSAKAKIALLASAVGAASLTPAESTAAGLLKGIAATTTAATGTPATTPAASAGG